MADMNDIANFHWTSENSQLLKQCRKAKDLSLRDVADKMTELGVPTTRTTINKWELTASKYRNKYIRPNQLLAMCSVLDCPPKDFINSLIYFSI